MNIADILKNIDRYDGVGENDKILTSLSGELLKEWTDTRNEQKDLILLQAKAIEKTNLHIARMTIFWNKCAGVSERAESTNVRGLMFAIRKDKNGNLILVETKIPEPPSIGGMLKQLGWPGA